MAWPLPAQLGTWQWPGLIQEAVIWADCFINTHARVRSRVYLSKSWRQLHLIRETIFIVGQFAASTYSVRDKLMAGWLAQSVVVRLISRMVRWGAVLGK